MRIYSTMHRALTDFYMKKLKLNEDFLVQKIKYKLIKNRNTSFVKVAEYLEVN